MIIIKTPQPDIEERLVLVPVAGPGAPRDATPVDLERAGYVSREQPAPGTLAHLRADLRDMTARAEKAELDAAEWAAEVDALRAEALAELADARRERDALLAELARLTAPAEGSEPTDEALRDAFEVAYRDAPSECCHANAIRALWRAGVAHERARQQPEEDRATDEELERAFYAAYDPLVTNGRGAIEGRSAGLLAVAARVRQERCLVARVVSASMSMHVYRRGHDGWAVALGPRFVECERADVPATLARLLGEVER